ncbi:YggS family pyridoxal phosphate-dependent enzyme [Faecalicoccus acidiformans]|uniref:YggS family pyridoxal phosphate-dependent enzyme n=1 Tax=Faecalicoccus acidiformans TaxID=915173 RepID=UPI0025A477A6|nr:YggS family pyridoxal phosphate-dependent enzyme [Faecalicoccus acidiformans]MDM8203772.1 YggS family pyridoxal phosphate-dependent enzyme [Faecalicoccus acidiformans]
MNHELIESLKTLKDVQVVAVSKKRSKEQIEEVAKAGLRVFGENRVQEFIDKYDPAYTWHIIGHLQTNKVKYIIGKVDLIESLDSLKLAKEIEKYAARQDLIQDVLVQIKISNDPMKTGLPYEEAEEFLKSLQAYPHIRVRGFMCVATHTDDMNLVAEEFENMHTLYKSMKTIYPTIDTLSMGMSHDYKIAIEHGANMVRIGTAIFE